jgi:hypothetical protein
MAHTAPTKTLAMNPPVRVKSLESKNPRQPISSHNGANGKLTKKKYIQDHAEIGAMIFPPLLT